MCQYVLPGDTELERGHMIRNLQTGIQIYRYPIEKWKWRSTGELLMPGYALVLSISSGGPLSLSALVS